MNRIKIFTTCKAQTILKASKKFLNFSLFCVGYFIILNFKIVKTIRNFLGGSA